MPKRSDDTEEGGEVVDLADVVLAAPIHDPLELGVVIGRRCRHVDASDARAVIAGYLVANDVSVRDWLQKRSPTFTLGKSFDAHGPIGPWLTTDDEVRDPLDLEMRLSVNGEERQHAWTNDMIYGIGAPTGRFLKAGDVVRAQIEGLGVIENRVDPEAPQALSDREAMT